MLHKQHFKARLKFANKYRHWKLAQWKNIIWSNECIFCTLAKCYEQKYWLKGMIITITYLPSRGGNPVMIWGCMMWAGLGQRVDNNRFARRCARFRACSS